jgi:hypothetical protein
MVAAFETVAMLVNLKERPFKFGRCRARTPLVITVESNGDWLKLGYLPSP